MASHYLLLLWSLYFSVDFSSLCKHVRVFLFVAFALTRRESVKSSTSTVFVGIEEDDEDSRRGGSVVSAAAVAPAPPPIEGKEEEEEEKD